MSRDNQRVRSGGVRVIGHHSVTATVGYGRGNRRCWIAETETEGQRGRVRDRKRERQSERQSERRKDRQTVRDTERGRQARIPMWMEHCMKEPEAGRACGKPGRRPGPHEATCWPFSPFPWSRTQGASDPVVQSLKQRLLLSHEVTLSSQPHSCPGAAAVAQCRPRSQGPMPRVAQQRGKPCHSSRQVRAMQAPWRSGLGRGPQKLRVTILY